MIKEREKRMANKRKKINYQTQILSSTNYIIYMLLSIVLIIVCLLRIFFSKAFDNTKFPEKIAIIVLVISIVIFIVSINGFISTKRINANLKNLPYKFDYSKEYATYHAIGRNITKVKNGGIKFDKYTEWKDYINTKFIKQKNNEDFFRFMNRIIRQKDRDIYIFEKILIPVEIAIVSILFGTGNMKDSTDLISFLCVTSFCIGFLEHEILNLKESVYFLKDFFEILSDTDAVFTKNSGV